MGPATLTPRFARGSRRADAKRGGKATTGWHGPRTRARTNGRTAVDRGPNARERSGGGVSCRAKVGHERNTVKLPFASGGSWPTPAARLDVPIDCKRCTAVGRPPTTASDGVRSFARPSLIRSVRPHSDIRCADPADLRQAARHPEQLPVEGPPRAPGKKLGASWRRPATIGKADVGHRPREL